MLKMIMSVYMQKKESSLHILINTIKKTYYLNFGLNQVLLNYDLIIIK